MAPVKPMGVRQDSNPKTKPGVTGFEQDYNDAPAPTQDLNPDAVADPSVLPEPKPAAHTPAKK
jgi:hypothetical protein